MVVLDGDAVRPSGVVAVDDRRDRVAPTPVLWLALALVLVPIVGVTLRFAIGGWIPDGDDAWVARRTMQVATTDPPLLGQESTSNDDPTQRGLNHPGPVAYYLLAVPYGASGWSPVGLAVGAGLVGAAGAAAAVVAAWRAAGDVGALAGAAGVLAMSLRISAEWLVRPTSSAMVALPLVAMAFGLWAYLRGDRLGLAVAALAGTFVLQTSLAALPLAGALALATAVVAGWRRVRRGHSAMSRAGWVVVAVVAVAWLPPVLEAVLSWPGNLIDLGHYLLTAVGVADRPGTESATLGASVAASSVAAFLFGVPGTDGRTLDAGTVWLVEPGDLPVASALVGAAVVVGVVGWAWWRRPSPLGSLLAVLLPSTVVAGLGLTFRPTDSLVTQTYFVIWLQALVAMAWTAVAYVVLDAASGVRGRERPVALSSTASLVGLAVLALVAPLVIVGTIDREPSERVADLSRQVRDELPPGTYQMSSEGTLAFTSVVKGIGVDLLRHGYDIRFTEWGGMVDEPRRRGSADLPRLHVVSGASAVTAQATVARDPGDPDDPAEPEDVGVFLFADAASVPFCVEVGSSLWPVLARLEQGYGQTVAEALDTIGAINAGLISVQLPDGSLRRSLEAFDAERPEAIAVLERLDPSSPFGLADVPDGFRVAYAELVEAFADRCDR